MRAERVSLSVLSGVAALFFAISGAAAATIVKVELQDSSTGKVKGMHMRTDRSSAPAGQVTFQVVNQSRSKEHEMLVIKSNAASPSAFPYEAGADIVDLSKTEKLGEVEDLEPGASGQVTVDLQPGSYLLICNEPGHAHQGMWARFKVTRR
jgi:uncharacterized cupredoxin-like copper-binding protein